MESLDAFMIFGSLSLVALFAIMFAIEKMVIDKKKAASPERASAVVPKKKRPS
ncbi:MAG: hypothetical protein HY652_15080 [Acidobacteria bacterium]|nr:hypothetical protein [Acidobacteriota bacterium]